MKLLSQEHYQLMAQFERSHSGRFDREDKSLWHKGIVYQDGRVNEMFLAYRNGYAFCEADMRSDLQNLEASRDGYRADAERNAKDAERYRWLRSPANDGPTLLASCVPDELDSALDAAITALASQKEKNDAN